MNRPGERRVSVVIPVYRSEAIVAELVRRIEEAMRAGRFSGEVILVNDASPDESWARIAEASQQHPWVRGIDLTNNAGQHNALLCGVRAATCDIVVTMDDDLQHPPEEIPKLLDKLDEGYDLVYGNPIEESRSWLRNSLSRLLKYTVLRASALHQVTVSSFRAFRTDLRTAFADFDNPHVFLDLLLTWGARRVTGVRVRHDKRTIGPSSYSVGKLFSHAFTMITSYSVLPLYVASWVGFLFTTFGALVLLYALVVFTVLGRVVPGFTFLTSIISIFSGAQLFAVGMVGLYLARIYQSHLGRPAYLVREIRESRTPTE
ncbi:MAG: glycosyltransferase family 2 protein [Candidatus Riflebacteria bacterium]|nr:glycosyltransferase family 2 protein [Candidatus Riflebacteria bacterium]